MRLILATNNMGKVDEFERMLSPLGIAVTSQSMAGINLVPEETADSFDGNAYIKAKAIYDVAHCPVIADDSGLEVYALDNAPGVYTARYGGEGLTDKQRYEKLLYEMRDVPQKNRGARFVCSICLVLSDEKHYTFTGICEGGIAFEADGENGFGYDPVFLVKLDDGKPAKSFAALSAIEKDMISHRGKALRALVNGLEEMENI